MTTDSATDVFAILAVAQANLPHDPVAGSEAVWRKWRELLGSFTFDEVRAALDGMVRDHRTLPPFAELLGELTRRRRSATSRLAAEERQHARVDGGPWRPPVDLPDGYVIGPYSAAFAAMNPDGWTADRLIECTRRGAASERCLQAQVSPEGHEATADPDAGDAPVAGLRLLDPVDAEPGGPRPFPGQGQALARGFATPDRGLAARPDVSTGASDGPPPKEPR